MSLVLSVGVTQCNECLHTCSIKGAVCLVCFWDKCAALTAVVISVSWRNSTERSRLNLVKAVAKVEWFRFLLRTSRLCRSLSSAGSLEILNFCLGLSARKMTLLSIFLHQVLTKDYSPADCNMLVNFPPGIQRMKAKKKIPAEIA